MAQFDPDEYLNELIDPKNDQNWKRAAGAFISNTYEMQRITNGRLSKLERAMWLGLGGLAVVTVVIVPLFIRMVEQM